jgi:hypothetical protein
MSPEQMASFTRLHLHGHGPGVRVRLHLKESGSPIGGPARIGADGPVGEVIQKWPPADGKPGLDVVEFSPSEILSWAEPFEKRLVLE